MPPLPGKRTHVGMLSGGLGSWAALKRVALRHGARNLTLLFADTRIEDEDLYRFLIDAAANIGAPLVVVQDGRTPWQVFRDVRYVGNTRVAPCSHILKQEQARKWLEANRDPRDTVLHVGIDWTEEHRFVGTRDSAGVRKSWLPWRCEAPLCREPLLSRDKIRAWAEAEGLRPPRLYDYGFPHNNCGGFCVKAGHAQFKLLLEKFPERYAAHEAEEQKLRQYLGKDVAILRDRRGGKLRPLPMAELRQRVQQDAGCVDPHDWGGCGCFADTE